MIGSAWRLAVGTLTAIPVRPPAEVNRPVAGLSAVLAPLAVVPLGALLTGWFLLAGGPLDLARWPTAVVGVALLALGTRAMHWDGLSDVADGLTASYDRERSLAVMKTGTSGPAGVLATVLMAMLQVSMLAPMTESVRGAVAAGVFVCLSRWALVLCCARGVPGARPDGLGAIYVGSVPVLVAVGVWVVAAAVGLLVLGTWRGAAGVVLAVLLVALLVHRAVRRFGGVTGDVFGAAIEVAFAALLVGG